MSLRDFDSADGHPIFLQNQPLGNGAGLGNFHTDVAAVSDLVPQSLKPRLGGAKTCGIS